MWRSLAVVWSSEDRPHPALGVSTDKVECFSDYMTLPIPRSHVEGLRQWLGRILQLPGTWKAPSHLDPLLAQCGYFLHPAPDGDFIFRAQYSACFVQREVRLGALGLEPDPPVGQKQNYRLEIRILHKGVKRLERREGYIMKCPATESRPGRQSIYCGPTFIQTPWLLSLRGELVASLEDASLMGLYVDVSATTVTVQSPRQELLRWQEVLNTSAELLPLWLVSGHYAYSLEAVCPLVSSQPGSEVLVHIPRQRLGLIKRGSSFEEPLSLKSLHVHQSNTFTVTENRDFVVVSIPSAALLRVQPCQEAQEVPGTQVFYRVDLDLEFAESTTPVLWTVENHFRCLGSRAESPASAATPRTIPSLLPPGLETHPAGWPSTASLQSRNAGLAAPAKLQPQPRPVLQAARPVGGGWMSTAPLSPTAIHNRCCPQAPTGETGLPRPPPASPTLSSGALGVVQAGPRPSRPLLSAPAAPATHLSSETSSPPSPSWRSDPSEVSLGSGPPVTLTEHPQQDTVHSPESPLPLGGLSGADAAATEPTQASKEFQPLRRPLVTRLAGEALGSHHSHRATQEMSSIMEAEGPPKSDRGLPEGVSRGYLDWSFPELSPGMEGLRLTVLPGTDGMFPTQGGRQADSRALLGTSGPESPRRSTVGPATPPTALPESPVASTSKRPAASSVGASDRAPDLELAPEGIVGWQEWGARTPGPPPLHALSPQAPVGSAVPRLGEPGSPVPAGLGASLSQDPTEATLATSPESPGPPGLLRTVEGAV